ncbi:MAG: hypothetical protein WBW47_03095 [Thermoplasmata archaeon]
MATKSGYYIDAENDSWARREAARRGTSKSDVGRDAFTQYRRSIEAVPSVSKVRSIKVRTTTPRTDVPRSTSANITSTENDTGFWRMAALHWKVEALKGQIDSHAADVSAGDPSSVIARSTIPGPAKPKHDFRSGSVVRVRRRDGSAYLARVL